MSAAGEELRGDCFQLWRDDADAMLALPDAERHEFTDALLAWFVNGETRPLSNQMLDWFLAQLTRKQTAAAKRHGELKARRAKAGRAGMKKRWGDKRITTDNNVMNENENENDNLNQTERNETGTPQAATVSPPFNSDSVSVPAAPPTLADLFSDAPSDSAINALISRVAEVLSDERPSVHKWRKFIDRNGARAFIDVAHGFMEDVRNGREIANKGAYFNALLDAYGTNGNGGNVRRGGNTNQPIGVIHHEEGYENPL